MAAPALVQIRHGYRAQSQGLSFAVETDAGEWILTVRNHDGATAYRVAPDGETPLDARLLQ